MNYSRENPSPRYLELVKQYRSMHELPPEKTKGGKPKEMFRGYSLKPYVTQLTSIIKETKSKTLLDYGSGKGQVYIDFNLSKIWDVTVKCYDPGHKPFSKLPEGKYDGVICTDVLEHIPEPDVEWVLDEIFGYATKFVFMNVSCKEAKKLLPDGTNAHCTIQPPEWWKERIIKANKNNVDLTLYATITEEDELLIGKPFVK